MGSFSQSIGTGCLQCSVEKDSEVSSRISGRECCDLAAVFAVGLGRRSRGSDLTGI